MSDHPHIESIQEELLSDDEFDVDSLFDSASPILERFPELAPTRLPRPCDDRSHDIPTAQRTAPPIPGLYFDPSLLIPSALALDLAEHAQRYFRTGTGSGIVNQVMLFGRTSAAGSGLPPFLDALIGSLAPLLKPHLPAHAHALLFPPPESSDASRQAIFNHYVPGEGITPHVDLLTRFADGIVAVSVGSGTVMTFRRVQSEKNNGEERWDVYLPERSILVFTGDARYEWSHGIEGRPEDRVEDEDGVKIVKRGTRVSVTLRWLLAGADVVGGMT